MLNRPDNWSMSNEGYVRVTKVDYYGNPYEVWVKPPAMSRQQLWNAVRPGLFQSCGGMQTSIDQINLHHDLINEEKWK